MNKEIISNFRSGRDFEISKISKNQKITRTSINVFDAALKLVTKLITQKINSLTTLANE